MAADGGCERNVGHGVNEVYRNVGHGVNEVYRAWGALKRVLSNRESSMNAKKCLHEGVTVPTAFYGAEAWGFLTLMVRVRNEEVRRSAGIKCWQVCRVDRSIETLSIRGETCSSRLARWLLIAGTVYVI